MKSYRKELWFDTAHRREYVNITDPVEQCLAESGIREGMLLCNHTQIYLLLLTTSSGLSF